MALGVTGRKWLFGTHIVCAAVWIGAGVAMNAIIWTNGAHPDGGELSGMNYALKLIDDRVIIPAALDSLLTGLVISLATAWGFFRFPWITVKWVATATLILVGTFILGPRTNSVTAMSATERIGALADPRYVANRRMLLVSASAQLVVLAVLVFLSVFKPWGARKAVY